ncbi:MAG: hypothetical protein IT381_00325 [Deltaproteobacteria bacterium]|nr:hypothetical protein [Deltaproteobacteria bacterium]
MTPPALKMTKVRDLTLAAPPSEGRGAYLAAASGLVQRGDHLFVVADDETQLGIFPAKGDGHGRLVQLFDLALPADPKERKRIKPDLEALALLDSKELGGAAVLAVGSGSTAARQVGALVRLDKNNEPKGKPERVDLSQVYAELSKRFTELNIEGASVIGDKLRLLQRGNGGKGEDAIVELDLARVLSALAGGAAIPKEAIASVKPFDLGAISGVRLSFTDASPLPDGRMVFTAAAEDSASTYHDGEVLGSAVGIIDKDGKVTNVRLLQPAIKAEGVHAMVRPDGDIDLQIVNDADDPSAAGVLFRARLVLDR